MTLTPLFTKNNLCFVTTTEQCYPYSKRMKNQLFSLGIYIYFFSTLHEGKVLVVCIWNVSHSLSALVMVGRKFKWGIHLHCCFVSADILKWGYKIPQESWVNSLELNKYTQLHVAALHCYQLIPRTNPLCVKLAWICFSSLQWTFQSECRPTFRGNKNNWGNNRLMRLV